jgi:hypothetical protein
MSVTAWGAAVMMAYAGGVAELPGWFRAIQNQPAQYAPIAPVVPNSCPAGKESLASGRCVDDCRTSCKRIRIVEEQTRFYGPDGKSLGTATPQGDGTIKYRDSQGRSVGSATTDQGGTT